MQYLFLLVVLMFGTGCTVSSQDGSPYRLPVQNAIQDTYMTLSVNGYPMGDPKTGELYKIYQGPPVNLDPGWTVGGRTNTFVASIYDVNGNYLGRSSTERNFPRYFDPYSGNFVDRGALITQFWVVELYEPPRTLKEANTRPPQGSNQYPGGLNPYGRW